MFDIDSVRLAVKTSAKYVEVLRKLGMSIHVKANYLRLINEIIYYEIDFDHLIRKSPYSHSELSVAIAKNRTLMGVVRQFGKSKSYFSMLLFDAKRWEIDTSHMSDIQKVDRFIKLTEKQMSIVNGLLLSDASIVYETKRSKTAVFSIGCKHIEFLKYIQMIMPFKTKIYFSQQKYSSWHLKSNISLLFNCLRKTWYPNGKKIVPPDLIIDKTVLLYWFFGDGTVWKSKRSISGRIGLATDGFRKSDVELLQNKLKQQLGINFSINVKRHKGKIY